MDLLQKCCFDGCSGGALKGMKLELQLSGEGFSVLTVSLRGFQTLLCQGPLG